MSAGPRRIPLSEPLLAGKEWEYVKECLDTGWVSTAGPFISRFEKEFAAYVGAPHAVAAVNGTAALHAALLAVGVEPGEEVLVANLTFVAPANAIRYCGAFPVFMDAHPDTWQIDAGKVARFLDGECETRQGACVNKRSGRRVRAIVPVHLLGLACEIDRIVEIARRHGLKVVEDAAEAMGVRYRGRHVGTFGDAGAFSFNGNKIMTTGGGGMIATADAGLARRAAYLTTQAKDDPVEYFHREIGFNYRLGNVQAALGSAQLERLPNLIARKRRIAEIYARTFAGVEGLTPMPTTPHTEATYWLYTILLSPETTVERRKAFIVSLGAKGIEARPLWHTLTDMPPFADCQSFGIEHSPRLYARAVSLPSGSGLCEDDVRASAQAVLSCLRAA